MHNLFCENEFYLHENEKSFPYQRLSTYPRLETEAGGQLGNGPLTRSQCVWVFIVQLVEHCSDIAEAMSLNAVDPRFFFPFNFLNATEAIFISLFKLTIIVSFSECAPP